jgi:hypothetical protein
MSHAYASSGSGGFGGAVSYAPSSSAPAISSGRPSVVPPVLGSAARFRASARRSLRLCATAGVPSSTVQLTQLAPLTTWSALDLMPEQPPEIEGDEHSVDSGSVHRLSGLRALLSVWREANLEQCIIKAAHYAQLSQFNTSRFSFK